MERWWSHFNYSSRAGVSNRTQPIAYNGEKVPICREFDREWKTDLSMRHFHNTTFTGPQVRSVISPANPIKQGESASDAPFWGVLGAKVKRYCFSADAIEQRSSWDQANHLLVGLPAALGSQCSWETSNFIKPSFCSLFIAYRFLAGMIFYYFIIRFLCFLLYVSHKNPWIAAG